MTQAMNKKINAYMMAAMMAVVSPAIMGQTASDGVKVIWILKVDLLILVFILF